MSNDKELLPCGHGCILGKPKGMATNGRCRCLDFLEQRDRHKVNEIIHYIKRNTRTSSDGWVSVEEYDAKQKHLDILAMHMAEVKAIADGESTNTLKDVVEHCLQEIKELPPAPSSDQEDKRCHDHCV